MRIYSTIIFLNKQENLLKTSDFKQIWVKRVVQIVIKTSESKGTKV